MKEPPTEAALLRMHACKFCFEIGYETFDTIDGQMIKNLFDQFTVTFDFRVRSSHWLHIATPSPNSASLTPRWFWHVTGRCRRTFDKKHLAISRR
jgi:hypothetical protein